MKQTPEADALLETESIAHLPEQESYPPTGYAWLVVGLLTLAYVFSFIDRQILSLMVTPIKRDLGISDLQMSLLMGASFAVFYTLFGIPLGRWADTRSRRLLIASGIAVWSLMTAGCGLTRKFWQLALMRMGVGVGEASLSPAAYSLISDYFRPERRATAIGVYSMGIYIGSGLASILGGLVVKFASGREEFLLPIIGAIRSWQMVFFVVGLPGLLVALLVLSIQEPSRKGLGRSKEGAALATAASFGEVWSYIRRNWVTFGFLNIGIGLMALSGYGALAWVPEFWQRRYAWTPGQTGVIFGSIVAVAGTIGIVAGGRLADWLHSRGRDDANVTVALLAALAGIPFIVAYPLMATGPLSAATPGAGDLLRQHAVWSRSGRNSTDDAQHDAFPSLGLLPVRDQPDRPGNRADARGRADGKGISRPQGRRLLVADRWRILVPLRWDLAVAGSATLSPQPGSLENMDQSPSLKNQRRNARAQVARRNGRRRQSKHARENRQDVRSMGKNRQGRWSTDRQGVLCLVEERAWASSPFSGHRRRPGIRRVPV